MDPGIDLQAIAASCNGFVGADLEALCREATWSASKRASKDADMLRLTMEDWKHARSVVGPSITRGVTVEIPNVTWEDIGGLRDLKVCKYTCPSHSEVSTDIIVFTFFMDRKSSNKQLSGLLNILMHLRGLEYHLCVGFFCMVLRDAQKPLLLKLQPMQPKRLSFP